VTYGTDGAVLLDRFKRGYNRSSSDHVGERPQNGVPAMTDFSPSISQVQSFTTSSRSRQAPTTNWYRAIGRQRDLVVVAAFCAIGLMVSFAVFAQLPDMTPAFAAINLVP
jgi:hypothetical protein